MAHTELQDFVEYAGSSYDSSQDDRIERALSLAERMLRKRVGIDFYDAAVPESDASQDWIFATCVTADWLMSFDDPDIRADISGPYKSERLGDWAYTLRDDMWTPFQDMRIRDIISAYTPESKTSGMFFFAAIGPRRSTVETTEN